MSCWFSGNSYARNYYIKGRVLDHARNDSAMVGASVRLLRTDSTMVSGQIADASGRFTLRTTKAGKYLVECKFMGYVTEWKDVSIENRQDSINIGNIVLKPSDITLGSATVRASAIEMLQKQDTIVFNAAAFRTMEGATLKKLVEQLPGVVVDDDGNITVNGKSVSEIKINGKDFFKGDTKVAMDNLPVDLVDKVRTYEEKSDYSKRTGIEDGNKKTVLDINLKKELKSTITTNGNISNGTQHRYRDELFANRFTDRNRQTVYGNMSNLNGWGWGLRANKNFGANFQWMDTPDWEAPKRYEINTGFQYNHDNSDMVNTSNSETFLSGNDVRSFSNSYSQSKSRSTGYSGNVNLNWKIDSVNFIWSYINIGHNTGDNRNSSLSANFNSDPYTYPEITDPLDAIFSDEPDSRLMAIAVNRNRHRSLSDNKSTNGSFNFGYFHRLDTLGAHIGLQGWMNFNDNSNHSYSLSDIQYYQVTGSQKPQSFYDQYVTSPGNSFNASITPRYTYAFNKHTHLGVEYTFSYSRNKGDRIWYQLDSLLQYSAEHYPELGILPTADSLALAYNAANSQYSTYNEYEHAAGINFNYNIPKKLTLRADVRLRPHHTRLDFHKGDFITSMRRDVFSFSPHVYLRYEIAENHTLDFNYNGDTQHPSMMNLIDVPDNSDPLNISRGNKDLKSSWSNNLNINYNKYNSELRQSISIYQTFWQAFNSISNMLIYVPETGVRITRPENINGNWNENTNINFSRSFGKSNRFQIDARNSTGYSESVGYVNVGNLDNLTSVKNTVKSINLRQSVGASYRLLYFDARVRIGFNYRRTRANQQESSNLDIYGMNYRIESHVRTKFHTELASNIRIQTRRGYSNPEMNTNEYIWNAELTQGLLKEQRLSIGVEVIDILKSRKNISYNVWATGQSESRVNTIGSYALFKLIYKFNIFGGGK